MTSDTPIATHGASASSGRCAVALGGSRVPITCEKLTPACSKTEPPRSTRLSPPPPSVRSHLSRANSAVPSATSSAEQMRSCRLRRYASTASTSVADMFRPRYFEAARLLDAVLLVDFFAAVLAAARTGVFAAAVLAGAFDSVL